jgi:hypothetical protein
MTFLVSPIRLRFSPKRADHRAFEGVLELQAYCQRPERLRPLGFLADAKLFLRC